MAKELDQAQFEEAGRGAGRGDGEFDIGDLVRGVWSVRGWLLAGMLVAVLVAGAALLALKMANYANVTEYIVEFRFDGRQNDQYPNGTPFSLSDVMAPAVIAEVYENEDIQEYGLSFREFQAALSITPFVINRQALIDQYSIDSRRATIAELRQAQDELERELRAASKRYAALRFSAGGITMPQSKISKILIEVARQWERNAIEVRGVLKLDMRAVQARIFDPSASQGLERLSALRLVRDKLVDLRNYLVRIGGLPGGNLVVDQETGYTVAGVLSLIERATVQLLEVPAGWTRSVAEDRSATLGMPINLYSARLFEPGEIENLDYLIAIDLVRERMRLVRENVNSLLALPFGDVASDPESNLTARDISRLLIDLDEFTLKQLNAPVLALGIAKNPEVVRLYYNSRLQEMRRSKETLASKARVLEQANQSYQGMAGVGAPGTLPGGMPGFPPSTNTVIPQFGDAFIDRLIELTQKGGDTQFRQDLLKQTVGLQQEAADIDAEIARIQEYMNIFGANATVQRTDEDRRLSTFFVDRLNNELPATVAKLREYAQVTERIAYRLRYAADILSVSQTETPPVAEGETAPVAQIKADFYLRDVQANPDANVEEVVNDLRSYAEIANRLYAQIGMEAFGSYQRLFRSASDPFRIRTPLVTPFEIIVVAFAAVAGLLLTLAGILLGKLIRRPQAA